MIRITGSMHGGEEQYLQGMVEWDGIPNRKYAEYKQITAEFNKIEKYGFPYKVQAEVALARSFSSQIAGHPHAERHDSQAQEAFNVFRDRNVDCRVVDAGLSDLQYKLLVIPAWQ